MSYGRIGYTDEFVQQREADEKRRQAELEAAQKENARIRAERLARLDAEREAKKREAEAEQEAQFAPIKKREMHRWLAEHPGMTQDDFEKHAWPHLREVVIGDTREAMIAREIETQKVRMGGW